MIEKQNWFLIGQVLQRLINKNCILERWVVWGQSNAKGWLGKNSVINKLILVLLLAYGDYAGRLNSAQTLFELCLSIAAQITHGAGAPPFSSEAKICSFCAVSNLWPCLCISDKMRFFGGLKKPLHHLIMRIPFPGTLLLDGKSVCSLGSYQFFPYACKTYAKRHREQVATRGIGR